MNDTLWLPAVALLIGMIAGAGCSEGPGKLECGTATVGIESVESVQLVGQLTGAASANKPDGVNVFGTDLGSMFQHSDDRIYFVFGDTFGAPGTPGSGGWRSNTMAFSTDVDPEDGIIFDGWITDDTGQAKALVEGRHDPDDGSGEVTKIPSHGWSIQGRQYLWIMSVKQWGKPGSWDVNHAEVAHSDDDGESWTLSALQFPPQSNFIQVAVVLEESFVYFFGIPAGRFGGVKLARVEKERVLEKSAYRFYDGTGWTGDEEQGTLVVPAPVGELSVVWNPALRRWIMTYLNEDRACIELREAPELSGPWGEPWQLVCAADYPSLYGAYMHEKYLGRGGRDVYLSMSRYGPYNVFLMKAVLVPKEAEYCE